MDKKLIWKAENFNNQDYSDYLEMDKFIKSLNLSEDSKFYLSSYSHDEKIEVNYQILETDEDYQERLKIEKNIKNRNKEYEYKQYLLLKAKFEGENNG